MKWPHRPGTSVFRRPPGWSCFGVRTTFFTKSPDIFGDGDFDWVAGTEMFSGLTVFNGFRRNIYECP